MSVKNVKVNDSERSIDSYFNEIKNTITANGGWDNRAHVWWTTTKEVDLSFTQGVFSKEQFSLLTGSKMLKKSPMFLSSFFNFSIYCV